MDDVRERTSGDRSELDPAGGEVRQDFRIAGMDCAEEVSALRSALAPVARDEDLVFNILKRRLSVRLPSDRAVEVQRIHELIAGTGLAVEAWSDEVDARSGQSRDRIRRLLCALSGVLVLIGYLNHGIRHGFLHALAGEGEGAAFPVASTIAYAGAAISGAWFVLPRAWSALRRLRPDMNLLMVIAIAGAVLIGEWFEASVVSFLFALALLLESWSVDRARKAIERLLDLSPPTVRVVDPDGGAARIVPIEEAKPGAVFSIRPGERVPLDGVIVRGDSHLDEASLTGESTPVSKGSGDPVFAGTINTEAALRVRATRLAKDSTLARIIHMVEEAQARRAPSERWVERFALRYTPIMMALALAMAFVPPVLGLASLSASIYSALVLLVIACPCALVISTPVSIVAALAAAARNGVLVKGGTFLEAAARVEALALDKTGTLTVGKPIVEAVEPFEGHTPDEILAWASGLESGSNHPLARAIVAHAEQSDAPATPAVVIRELPGRGLEGTVAGRNMWIGGHRLVHERAVESPEIHARLEALEARGLTVVALGDERHVCGLFGLADEIRAEAGAVVGRLHALGVRPVVMLTGDHPAAAERVAQATGVDEVCASLLPEAKVEAIERLADDHGIVAMVGDGVNDAPALATARLGIAMGAVGSDVAIETADIALMSDDLSRVPWLIVHARRTLRVIRQNVVLALGPKLVVLGLSVTGIASLWMAIAADMGASLVVIANALRLTRS